MWGWQVRTYDHQAGDSDAVVFSDQVPEPILDRADLNSVIVQVAAAAANFADSLTLAGQYQERPPVPFVPGIEVAGTIIASSGDRFSVGDRVVGLAESGSGSWAERARCDARQLIRIPDDVTDVDAIGLHINAQTAWFALHRRAKATAEDTVLVHAAAGGVGSMAVQLALAAGCHVFATASALKQEFVRALGVTQAFDNRDSSWPEQLRSANDGRGVDVVVDPVGGSVFEESWRLLNFEGRLVTVGFAAGVIPSVKANHALVKNVSLLGLYWTRYTIEDPQAVAVAADAIFELHRQGLLDSHVRVVAPMREALDRVADVAAGRGVGKTVLVW